MPKVFELESATRVAVIAAWLAGAVVGAYLLGWSLSWLLLRIGRRSELIRDIAVLTRRPVRATLMAIAAHLAVDGTIAASTSWRGWIDHLLHILIIAAVTWLVASLVRVAERRSIARFAG
ncbi:MAG: potassium transporter KefA, partial [Mycobacterium sp.]|nr:potassium transporter KefA [Mycobacterium sp.]